MSTETDSTAERFGLTKPRSAGLSGLVRKGTGTAEKNKQETAAVDLTLASIPDPDDAAGSGALSAAERRDLEVCERAARTHHTSFWLTGKALDAVAKRHLYREKYETFDALLADWGITLADSSRMRRGWRLAERLLQDEPKLSRSHVEELLPVVKRYDVDSAVTLYGLLRESLPKVTATAIRTVVQELPGPDDTAIPATAVREQAEALLTDPTDSDDSDHAVGRMDADSAALRKAVDQRARDLANDLKRSRMSRGELTRTLTEAFADPDDPTVYRALIRWMKARNRSES
ncbi:hypothetical protein ACPCAG_32935 [Streptomyces pseudogriseolus]|uniref:hypothetical protein n=1 Tax=Streptomyces pseudogriseolus TaxID=36817 RepID=UPI003FA2FA5D